MLLASNWREVEMLPALAEAWGASAVVVNNLSFIADAALYEESLFARPDLWPQVLELLETVRAQATARGIAFHYYRPDAPNPYAQCTERVLTTCFVSWRGDVAPCVLTNLGFKADAAPKHYFQGRSYPVESCVFGNVNETTLDVIWKSKAARIFRAAFERRLSRKELSQEQLPPWCRRCYKIHEL
jgi:MoaA/NifB/PqqE/SkfB family radical SAM enzyme